MIVDKSVERESRIGWLDLAKCFSIFGVLVDHTNRILYTNQIIAYASYFSVSLFILVMGFTTYRSLAHNKNRTVIKYLWRRTEQMIVPYIIATIICYTAFSRRFVFQDIITHLINFDACLPYYYIILYLQLLWVSPIVFLLINKSHVVWKELVIAIAVIAFSVLTTNRSDIMGIYGGGGKLFGGTYLILLYLGMLVAKNYNSIQKIVVGGCLKSLVLCSIGFALSIAWCLWMAKDQLNLDKTIKYFGGYNPPGVSFIIYSILVASTAFFAEQLAEKFNCRKILEPFFYIGRNTLPIFLYFILFRSISGKLWALIGTYLLDQMWIKRLCFLLLMTGGPLLLMQAIKNVLKYYIEVYLDCDLNS